MKQKKTVSFLLCCLLFFSAVVYTAAASTQTFTLKKGNEEVIIEHSGLDIDMLNGIAQTLLTGTSLVAAAPNPWCIINGHDLEYVSAELTRHKVYSSQPRCVEEVYDVEQCKRCDYANYSLRSSTRVYCCN
mgnify:CR=1 FL=1